LQLSWLTFLEKAPDHKDVIAQGCMNFASQALLFNPNENVAAVCALNSELKVGKGFDFSTFEFSFDSCVSAFCEAPRSIEQLLLIIHDCPRQRRRLV